MVEVMIQEEVPVIFRSTAVQAAVLIALAALLGNVNAIVDSYLHPEIPYFDQEHLVVGGATAIVGAALSMLVLLYLRRLRSATATIDRLVALLPICAHCKRIRTIGGDPGADESWQPIESYITKQTGTEFSHGICPRCSAELYPEHGRDHGR